MIQHDELLFVVDEKNNPLKPLPRAIVHRKKLWHRTSHVWIITKDHQLVCHQRSVLKDISPGNWDPYFGGHLAPNTSYRKGAVRELKEKIDIIISPKALKLYRIYKNNTTREFQGIFIYNWDGNVQLLSFEEEEIAQIKCFPIEEVQQFIKAKIKDWSQVEYGRKILTWLMKKEH